MREVVDQPSTDRRTEIFVEMFTNLSLGRHRGGPLSTLTELMPWWSSSSVTVSSLTTAIIHKGPLDSNNVNYNVTSKQKQLLFNTQY